MDKQMKKTNLILFVILFTGIMMPTKTFAVSGDTFLDKKNNTIYIEEMLTITFNTAYEANEYKTTAKTQGINPNSTSQQNVSASAKTSNIVLNVDIEMDFAPKWFLGADARTNISTGRSSQNFTNARYGTLEYNRSHIGLYLGHRSFFISSSPDNLWQLKTYAGLRYVTTKATTSDLSYHGITITKQSQAPDNITDKSQTVNGVLGLALSRRFKQNNFVEIYAEFGNPLENETKTSYNDNFIEDSASGSTLEMGVTTSWRYTPQSFFAVGIYYGIISFDGGELTQINYIKNDNTETTYYQWGENETTYWGISASCILKF